MNAIIKSPKKISLGHSGNALVLLIGANLVVYIALIFLKGFYFITSTSNSADVTNALYHQDIIDHLLLPASFTQFIRQPWTLISYMFCHENLLDLFSNLLWLAAFGYILQSLAFNKIIIPLYLYGGFGSGVVFVVVNLLFPQQFNSIGSLEGASLAIVAVATGAVTLASRYKIFPMLAGGIPLWILYAVFMLICISPAVSAGLPYIAAILSSAGIGFFVVYQLKRGKDYGEWMYHLIYKIDDLFNPENKHIKNKQEVFYKTNRKPYETKERITQNRVDELLDKINTKGYDSLTKSEKEILHRAGEL